MADADNTTCRPLRMANRKKPLPDINILLSEACRIYKYNCADGGLVWIEAANRNHPGQTKIGANVGGDDGHGYLMCMLLGYKFKVHQIVWMLHHRSLPDLPIDHINRDRRDNRIENFRLATDKQNAQNRKNTTRKFAGVAVNGSGFISRINYNGKKLYLGFFKTKEDAHDAYVAASREIRGDYSAV